MLWTIVSQLIGGSIDIEKFGLYLLYPDKGLWFLWVLFFINVIFLLGSYFADKIKVRQEWVVVGICLALVAVMVVFEVRIFGYQFIAYYFLFYALGFFFHKSEKRVASTNYLLLSFLSIFWAILAWFWKMHELPAFMKGFPLPTTITQYSYRFITAAIAVYLLLVLSPKWLNSTCRYNQPFVMLGNMSLGVYAVHFMFLRLWIGVFDKFGLNVAGVIVAAFAMTLGVTWLIVWLLSKWKVTATWLLGKI